MYLSIIIPVYNEEKAVKKTVETLSAYLHKHADYEYEIIAVNDGSSDGSSKELQAIRESHFTLVEHPYNKGYGASLKTGVRHSKGDWVLFYDSDGQHTPEEIDKLVGEMDGFDMVVGAREVYNGPMWRMPGKKILSIMANYLVQFKIPDLNSGFRLVKKELFNRFVHLYPEGFSLTTTITLACIRSGFFIKYVPIQVKVREGKSSVRVRDGFNTIKLIVNMIMLFSPLRIFFPASFVLFVVGGTALIYDLLHYNISDSTTLVLLASILLMSFGLLAEQVAAIRRERPLVRK